MWQTLLPIAGNLLGNFLGNKSNKKAAGAQVAGLQQGADAIKGYYGDAQNNLNPYMQSGLAGNSKLMGLMNDPNSIADSGAYQWRFNQGMQGLDRSAASRGSLFSGGHQQDVMNYGQGLASQEYGNEWQRLAGLAGAGQNAASNLGSLGQGAGNSLANLYSQQGNARASSYQANGMNNSDMFNSIGGALGGYFGKRG